MTLTLTPAYGRDYKSKAEVVADWSNNKDFIIANFNHPNSGGYINIEDAMKNGIKSVNIRYKGLTSITVVSQKASGEWKAA